MRPVVIRAEAEADIIGAALWYEKECEGLGGAFSDEVDRTVARIAENPLRFQRRYEGIRMAMVDRFPYGLYLQDEGDQITLFAVLHLRRHPEAWKQRR